MMLTVRSLSAAASVLAGRAGLRRRIISPHLVAPDLTSPSTWRDLGGAVVHLTPDSVASLRALPAAERRRRLGALLRLRPACIVVTGGTLPAELAKAAEASKIAVLKSTSLAKVRKALTEGLPTAVSLHGVLVEVFGLGTLILGESAIGKSEAALDLVLRGHKLVADDVVLVERAGERITGRPAPLGADLLAIRGLGVIDVRALYGDTATAPSSVIGLVVELEEWKQGSHYSLLGLRERRYRVHGLSVPYLKLPVKPGRNMATLIEVAARNQMLKNRGIYTARELNRKLTKRLGG